MPAELAIVPPETIRQTLPQSGANATILPDGTARLGQQNLILFMVMVPAGILIFRMLVMKQ